MEKKNPEKMLIQVDIYDRKSGKEFTKGFDTIDGARRFINRAKRGKRLFITCVRSWSRTVLQEVGF